MPALRNGNVAGQEVREPCLHRVLVRLNGDCHKEMICVGVQRKGAAHLRDRLTLRLLRSQHMAAIADYLMVFTATIRHTIFPGRQR
jgi:hypothetical protein